jgi:hypothetical protein
MDNVMVPHMTPCEASITAQNGPDRKIDDQGVFNGGLCIKRKIIIIYKSTSALLCP